jgi:hypothetical protein
MWIVTEGSGLAKLNWPDFLMLLKPAQGFLRTVVEFVRSGCNEEAGREASPDHESEV